MFSYHLCERRTNLISESIRLYIHADSVTNDYGVVKDSFMFFSGYDGSGGGVHVSSSEFEGNGSLNGTDSVYFKIIRDGTITIA